MQFEFSKIRQQNDTSFGMKTCFHPAIVIAVGGYRLIGCLEIASL